MPVIGQMFAFIAEDSGPTDEGIVAFTTPGGMAMPMVGADMARVDFLRPIAREIAKKTGRKITLVLFNNRIDLEVIA